MAYGEIAVRLSPKPPLAMVPAGFPSPSWTMRRWPRLLIRGVLSLGLGPSSGGKELGACALPWGAAGPYLLETTKRGQKGRQLHPLAVTTTVPRRTLRVAGPVFRSWGRCCRAVRAGGGGEGGSACRRGEP